MSQHTCTIKVSTGAAEFLHSVLDSTPSQNTKDSNKMAALFRALKPVMQDSKERRTTLENQWIAEEEVDDGKGGKSKVKRIPEAKRAEYEKELEKLIDTEVEVTFDRESFVYLKNLMDNIFDRNPMLKTGLTGALHIRLHDEVMTAISETKAESTGASKKK